MSAPWRPSRSADKPDERGLLLEVNGHAFQKRPERRIRTCTTRMVHQESLRTGAIVRPFPGEVQDDVNEVPCRWCNFRVEAELCEGWNFRAEKESEKLRADNEESKKNSSINSRVSRSCGSQKLRQACCQTSKPKSRTRRLTQRS